jgi:TRAP transporter TAXI family solute receptor
MSIRRYRSAFALILSMLVLIAGCGGQSSTSSGSSTTGYESGSSSGSASQPSAPTWGSKRITIAAGSSGGVYYLWAGALAKIWTDKVPGLQVNVEATTGQLTNFDLMAQKRDEVAMWNSLSGYEAWEGLDWAKGKKYQDQRTMFAMYPSALVMGSPQNSPIKSISDWNGKRVGFGTPKGTIDVVGRNMLDVLGVKPAKIVNTGWNDVPGTLRDGQIDAVAAIGGQPWPAFVDIETTHKMNYYTFTEDQFQKIMVKYPYYTRYTLPKGTYASQTQDLKTFAFWNQVYVHKDTPSDLVYAMLKAVFDNRDSVDAAHPSTAKYLDLKATIDSATVPLHPGAIKYLEEKGIQVPDKLKAK